MISANCTEIAITGTIPPSLVAPHVSTAIQLWLLAFRAAAIWTSGSGENFGMPHPEGYRKALRLMKMAAKFAMPILTLVDTSGAYPGVEAEERGQAEAIARNLYEMSHLPVPIIVAITGQAFSGGAIGITVGDRILMMEHSCYSVIVPESCSTILFKVRERKEEAAEALKLTASDLQEEGIIDRIVGEPFGGAHRKLG